MYIKNIKKKLIHNKKKTNKQTDMKNNVFKKTCNNTK